MMSPERILAGLLIDDPAAWEALYQHAKRRGGSAHLRYRARDGLRQSEYIQRARALIEELPVYEGYSWEWMASSRHKAVHLAQEPSPPTTRPEKAICGAEIGSRVDWLCYPTRACLRCLKKAKRLP